MYLDYCDLLAHHTILNLHLTEFAHFLRGQIPSHLNDHSQLEGPHSILLLVVYKITFDLVSPPKYPFQVMSVVHTSSFYLPLPLIPSGEARCYLNPLKRIIIIEVTWSKKLSMNHVKIPLSINLCTRLTFISFLIAQDLHHIDYVHAWNT